MAESSDKEKSLEMRVAELEDKLSGMQITEEEMRAFNKVSAMLAGAPGGGAGSPAGVAQAVGTPAMPVPADCVIQQCVRPCVIQQCIRSCTIVAQCIRSCTVVQQCSVIQQCIRSCTIIQDCINECGGGFGPGGGISGGGFGTLGG